MLYMKEKNMIVNDDIKIKIMKRLVLLSVLAMMTLVTSAQSRVNFTLNTRCEYIIHKDSVKTYYVFPYEGESQSALYNKALIGVTKTFVSAKDVVSKVENSMISINSTYHFDEYLAGGIVKMSYDVNYVVELEFKDGKIKVNAPTIVSIRSNGRNADIRDCILTTDGRLSRGWTNYLFVNDVINNILANIKTSSNDDW